MRWFYRCATCGATYEIEPTRYLCETCSRAQRPDRPLSGILEAEWEGDVDPHSSRIPLPVAERWFPPIPVGHTPLWEPKRLREGLGFPHLYLKDDSCNPTGSYKDRASYLVAAFAAQHGIGEIALASTGNASSSMAGVGAAAGIKVTVFLPAGAPEAKRIQVLQYGAELRVVDGTYDEAYDRSLDYTADGHALSRNTGYNPLTIEGKKTAAYEIAGQLATLVARGAGAAHSASEPGTPDHRPTAALAPDHLFVPVGDGAILAGLYRGFENLLRLGRISRVPTLWACQAEGSNAVARALEGGEFGAPVPSHTIADSISVDVPRNGAHALSKLQAYAGRAVSVTDAQILAAQHRLAAATGLFAEPSSSAAFAAFLKVRHTLNPESRIVLLITGSGLKDIAAASRGLSE